MNVYLMLVFFLFHRNIRHQYRHESRLEDHVLHFLDQLGITNGSARAAQVNYFRILLLLFLSMFFILVNLTLICLYHYIYIYIYIL